MAGKSGFRSYPKRLGKPDGKGLIQCDRSGFLRKPSETMSEYTGSAVAREFADITPGFGTRHPQDVNQAETGGDPSPIPNANPIEEPVYREDIRLTDAEWEQMIREGKTPEEMT